MRQPTPSSVLQELIWLGTFILVFVILLAAVNLTLVRQGFNAKIAIVLVAVVSGIVMIALRYWLTRRKRPK
ncbi:MAG: hypothetical protein ABI182_04205 [Candidatus Baltobacteraceae bacterium]